VNLELLARFIKPIAMNAPANSIIRDGLVSRPGACARCRTASSAAAPAGRHLIDLGVKPGPAMGGLLKAVYERQLDGEITSLDEAVAAARALIANLG
jgi:hypothetical protein